jgi:predicted transcriptional regulator
MSPMASETLRLTAQIVASHASMTELTPKELVAEIKNLYRILAALEDEDEAPETKAKAPRAAKISKAKLRESPEAKAIHNEEGLDLDDPDYMEFMESREG